MCETIIIKNMNELNHGYGTPPIEKGIWFIKSKHIQNPEHPAGYWGLYHLGSIENWEWSDEILEYFGPIPFEVWDKKEEREEKSELQNELANVKANWDHKGLFSGFICNTRQECRGTQENKMTASDILQELQELDGTIPPGVEKLRDLMIELASVIIEIEERIDE